MQEQYKWRFILTDEIDRIFFTWKWYNLHLRIWMTDNWPQLKQTRTTHTIHTHAYTPFLYSYIMISWYNLHICKEGITMKNTTNAMIVNMAIAMEQIFVVVQRCIPAVGFDTSNL